MNLYVHPIRAHLTKEQSDYVSNESARLGVSLSAVVRQALDLRKATQRRAAEIDAAMLANETGAY